MDHINKRTTWEDPRGKLVTSGTPLRERASTIGTSRSGASTPQGGSSISRAATASATTSSSSSSGPKVPTDLTVSDEALGPLPSGWEVRKTPGGKSYWVDHNTKTTTWDDPRIPTLDSSNADQSRRDFRRKLIYFRSQPAQRPVPGDCRVVVRRNNLFEDAFAEIMKHKEEDLRKRLMITFKGEEGVDFGGVSRCV